MKLDFFTFLSKELKPTFIRYIDYLAKKGYTNNINIKTYILVLFIEIEFVK